MAIRIINDEPAKSVKREVVCSNCGVTLEYLPLDIRKTTSTDYGGGTDDYFWIDCPKCRFGNQVDRP